MLRNLPLCIIKNNELYTIMNSKPLFHLHTITEYHRAAGLPNPEHPLISLVRLEDLQRPLAEGSFSLIYDFYSISMKRVNNAKFKYGQQASDFDEGVLFFMAPGQVFGMEIEKGSVVHRPEGWMILIHPDFLWNSPLAKTIKQYEFFNYSVYEALYLSDKEEMMLTSLAQNIEQEYHANIDRFSQSVIIAQLELFLTFSERYYQRQFITRKITSHEILSKLEDLLSNYFSSGMLSEKGLPSVTYIAECLIFHRVT